MNVSMGWLTHYVHACQLRPYLREDTDMGSVKHVWFEEFEERRIGIVALKLAHVFNILQLTCYKGAVGVAFAVD